MPTYLYYCEICKQYYEYFEESPKNKKDDSEMICLSCGNLWKRIYNATPVMYKTKGFYVTDNPKEKNIE